MDAVLWGVFPYLTIAVLVGGTIWRYRYDKFGWTTRSSQLYESRLLRIGSPLFHFGILLVIIGHIGGLVVPQAWTEALGISQPGTSKHLRVLREAGLVSVRQDAQRRWYELRPAPLAEVDAWLEPYRWMWADRLEALGRHLDAMPEES